MTGEGEGTAGPDEDPAVSTDYRFAPMPEALLYDHEVDNLAFRVYGALMRHGLDPDSCFPSHRRIGELLGISERSVQRPLRTLEQRGWVRRKPRFNRRGDRITDGYFVYSNRQETALADAPTAPDSAGGDAGQVRADERVLDRASERALDRAGQRGQEREPGNESHPKESHPDQELAGDPDAARRAGGQPADDRSVRDAVERARRAALVIADERLAWRDPASIDNRAALAAHIAREEIWPQAGQRLSELAARHPAWEPDQLAAEVTLLSTDHDERVDRAQALSREAETRAFLDASVAEVAVDEGAVRSALAEARAALEEPC